MKKHRQSQKKIRRCRRKSHLRRRLNLSENRLERAGAFSFFHARPTPTRSAKMPADHIISDGIFAFAGFVSGLRRCRRKSHLRRRLNLSENRLERAGAFSFLHARPTLTRSAKMPADFLCFGRHFCVFWLCQRAEIIALSAKWATLSDCAILMRAPARFFSLPQPED